MKQKMAGLRTFATWILVIFVLNCIGESESKRKGIEQQLNGSNGTGRSLESEGTPRICDSSISTTTPGGTDFGITSILTSLFGGDLSAVGFALGIPVAIGSAIFWGIVFLIIYYVVFYKKSEEGGYGGGGYGQSQYGSPYGRSFMNSGLNQLSDMAWKAIDKFAEYNDNPK